MEQAGWCAQPGCASWKQIAVCTVMLLCCICKGMGTNAKQGCLNFTPDHGNIPGLKFDAIQVKDDQHLTLTTEQIKRMPWQQHARIWKVHPAAGTPAFVPACFAQWIS